MYVIGHHFSVLFLNIKSLELGMNYCIWLGREKCACFLAVTTSFVMVRLYSFFITQPVSILVKKDVLSKLRHDIKYLFGTLPHKIHNCFNCINQNLWDFRCNQFGEALNILIDMFWAEVLQWSVVIPSLVYLSGGLIWCILGNLSSLKGL